MTVPKQHSRILVSALAGDLRQRQIHLEEAADGLMPKVMKAKVFVLQPCPLPYPLPGKFERLSRDRKQWPLLAMLLK